MLNIYSTKNRKFFILNNFFIIIAHIVFKENKKYTESVMPPIKYNYFINTFLKYIRINK